MLPPQLRFVGALLTSTLLLGCTQPSILKETHTSTHHVLEGRSLLPAKLDGSLFIIEVLINGRGPFRMILDTGASGLVLGTDTAAQAKLELYPKTEALVSDATGRTQRRRLAQGDLLEAGGFRLSHPNFVLLPQDEVSRIRELTGTRFEGILGINAFTGLVLELDYPAATVRVFEPTQAPSPSVPAHRYTGLVPRLPLKVAGRNLVFAVDTGAEYFFSLSSFDSTPLVYPKNKAEFLSVQAGGITRNYRSQLAGEIALGKTRWLNPPLEQSSDNRLGAPALALSRITLDCARGQLWIEDSATMRWDTDALLEKDGRPVSVGALLLPARDGWHVGEIDSGGRAERAGLRPGDRITAIRGLVSNTPLHDSPFHTGYKHRLTVMRSGEPFECTLDLTAP